MQDRFLAAVLYKLYVWACRLLYDELAWSYDAVSWLVSAGRWEEWRRLALDYVVGEHVLEIGFGTGELLTALAGHGSDVVGLELSPAMHLITTAKLRSRNLQAPRVRASALSTPFTSNAFDTIVATFPAEYVLEVQFAQECARLLRGDGRLVIVGLWVDLDSPWLQSVIPVFYGRPSQPFLDRLEERFSRAGFSTSFEERRVGGARVGVVVASLQDDCEANEHMPNASEGPDS